mgnify:CR=1 FL=1
MSVPTNSWIPGSCAPTTPRAVLVTDGDGAYWVAVWDEGMAEWVDAHSEEVLEVAAWAEVPRWDGRELPSWPRHDRAQ